MTEEIEIAAASSPRALVEEGSKPSISIVDAEETRQDDDPPTNTVPSIYVESDNPTDTTDSGDADIDVDESLDDDAGAETDDVDEIHGDGGDINADEISNTNSPQRQ